MFLNSIKCWRKKHIWGWGPYWGAGFRFIVCERCGKYYNGTVDSGFPRL